MAKQSILGRTSQLVRADINSILDQAADPPAMLEQLVRDYTHSIADAESAAAQTMGNLQLMEQDHTEDRNAANDWGHKALTASNRADELRASGNHTDADRFDNLAKTAISRQVESENEARAVAPTIASQKLIVDQLTSGLKGMRAKLTELIIKRGELMAQPHHTIETQLHVPDALTSINLLDATGDLGRFDDKIRREEAKVHGTQQLTASSLDAQFDGSEDAGKQNQISARLAALKSGGEE